MLNRRPLLLLALLAVLGGFGYGLVQLFKLRFASGDNYPAYSSLRGDPLGCRVYFESLEQLSDSQPRRFTQSIGNLPEGKGATLFVFGLPWSEMSAEEDEYKALESFVRGGGRLVVTLYPELKKPHFFTSGFGTNGPAFKNPLLDDEHRHPPVNLREKWGFGYEFVPGARENFVLTPVVARRIQSAPLPETLSWHSALVLTNLDFTWRILYARGTDPVMIEKQHGNGSIVVATDSYFVSNEALRQERAADLLAWLAGGSREILFDETHLGVQERPGVATLFRRYQLHGGVIALLALAALFIWKSSVSFIPRTNELATTPILGRESAAGFENLLRRSIAPKDLLQTSLDEWHKSAPLDQRATDPRREKIRAVVDAYNAQEKPNVVETYREIAGILNRKKLWNEPSTTTYH
ncbi:MAG TPA: DUF4350 domain-containing protein [Candidatus Limnocylindria bacterium]|nr:DUF4350 domain-containing protein [Candidatus Limnocylindria bacterium]